MSSVTIAGQCETVERSLDALSYRSAQETWLASRSAYVTELLRTSSEPVRRLRRRINMIKDSPGDQAIPRQRRLPTVLGDLAAIAMGGYDDNRPSA